MGMPMHYGDVSGGDIHNVAARSVEKWSDDQCQRIDMPEEILTELDGKTIDGLAFCKKAYEIFEGIRGDDGGVTRIRTLSSRPVKRLMEEVLPICKYVQSSYRTGRYLSVCWVNGSQPFDAKIFQRGSLVEQGYFRAEMTVEVTTVRHPNEHLLRERIDKEDFAFGLAGLKRSASRKIESSPVVLSSAQFVEEFALLLIGGIRKKIEANYPEHSILIVGCCTDTVYLPEDWTSLESLVRAENIEHNFAEIFIYDFLTEASFRLD